MARRKKLKHFLFDHLESGDVPGLVWEDKISQTFRIPWKHANRRGNNFVPDKDTLLPKLWAINTMKFDPDSGQKPNPSRWKTNLRCSLNSLKHRIQRLEARDELGYHLYCFCDHDSKPPSALKSESSSPDTSPAMKSGDDTSVDGASFDARRPSSSSHCAEKVLPGMLSVNATQAPYPPATSLASLIGTADSLDINEVNNIARELTASLSSTDEMHSTGHHPMTSQPSDGTVVDIFDSLIAGNPASSFASNMPVPVALQADRPFGLNLAEAGGTVNDRITLTSPAPQSLPVCQLPENHEIQIQVCYTSYAVAGITVTNTEGCRLHFDSDPSTLTSPRTRMTAMASSNLELLRGQQLQVPQPGRANRRFNNPRLHQTLEDFRHGLHFEVAGNELFTTRHCVAEVGYSLRQVGGTCQPLVRNHRTSVLNISNFSKQLQDFSKSNLPRARPSIRVYFVVGEQWLPGMDFADCLFTIQVTCSRSEAMMQSALSAHWSAPTAAQATVSPHRPHTSPTL